MEKAFKDEKTRSKVTIYHIVYRNSASKKYDKILLQLKKYYPSTPIKFEKNLISKLELLKVNPKMYQTDQKNSNKRKIPLLYGYYFTYIIKEDVIYISDILNSRNFQ